MIEVRKSPVHGKGVFSSEPLDEGTELTCDVLVIHQRECSVLLDYHFSWRGEIAICAGFGSFFNHSRTPNVSMARLNYEDETMTFKTLRRIEAGEELFISYGKHPSKGLTSNS